MVQTGQKASELVKQFDRVPQMLSNVRFSEGALPLEADDVRAAIEVGEKRLAGRGRLVIRKAGTEPLIRVMAEAENEDMLREVVDGIVAAVERAA